MTEVLTVLKISEIATNGEWKTLDVGRQLEACYRSTTEWKGTGSSAGLSIVVARRAFTRDRRLPAGGVLLGIDLRSVSPPPSDGRYEFLIDTDVAPHRSGKSLVRVLTQLRISEGKPVAGVMFAILWPNG